MNLSLTATRKKVKKILLFMKLTAAIILFVSLQVSATGYSQKKFTLQFKKTEITNILAAIEKQSDFRFLYNDKLTGVKQQVELNIQNATLAQVLDQLLVKNNLYYELLSGNLVVIKNENAHFTNAIQVKGRITNAAGTPVAGASVIVKGSNKGVATDADGSFSINAKEGEVLVISAIGYETQEMQITSQSLNIVLHESKKDLDQVVVVGYGSQKKKNITGSVATVSAADIASRPLIGAGEAITGKAAGVQVAVASGTPGGDLSIRIRGVGSPNGGEPLYVVDGVLANDIKGVDPNTIESISILKDAASAGIYGAAGSTNGVVMITTKQGSKGKPKVDVNVYTGMQQIAKKIGVLNNTQWLALQKEINGTEPIIPSYYDLKNTNNNWQNMIYRNAMQTGANLGVSGGTDKGTYYLGGGYLSQDGIMKGSNFKRYSVKFSIDQNATNWLKLGANASFNRSNERTIPQNLSSQGGGAVIAALVTPEYIPVTMPVGSPNPGVYGYSNFFSGDNPLSDIFNNNNKTIQNHFLGNVYTEIKLPCNLKFRSQFNAVMDESRYTWFLDPYKSLYGITKKGSGRENYSETFRWIWDNTLTYNKVFGKNSLNVVVGTSALNEKIFISSESGDGFASSAVQTLNGASTKYAISSSQYQWSTNSYFGRINYSYDDRYLLTATLRADGSSRVGENNRWGTFPAISAGWRISNEAFMKNVDWIKDLKLRAGWGTTGNLPPYTMLYPSYTLLSAGAAYSFDGTGAAVPGVSPGSQIGNRNLKWEAAQQSNIGVDATFLNNRITFTADYYYKKVKNMIFTQQLPLTMGGAWGGVSTAANLPGYDINKGFEYMIDAVIIKNKKFSWDVNWNMSFNNNKITGMDSTTTYQTGGVSVGGAKSPIYTGVIKNGYSLGTFWGYTTKGVDPKTGNFVYSDAPGNLGCALPKYTYGFTNNFHYSNFSLSLLFDGVQGNKIYDETRMEIENLNGYTNESSAVLARWEKSGDVTNIPRALGNGTTNKGAAALLQSQIASNYVENGSFFRLHSASLAYQFDADQLKRIGIAGLRIYASAQNIFTITKYKGYYPEVNGFGTGTNNQATKANEGASLMALGIDNGTYPTPRTYIIGINVQL